MPRVGVSKSASVTLEVKLLLGRSLLKMFPILSIILHVIKNAKLDYFLAIHSFHRTLYNDFANLGTNSTI